MKVYRYTNRLIDVLADNPMAMIYKNVKTKLSTEEAKVSVGDNVYTVEITPLEIYNLQTYLRICFWITLLNNE